MKLKIATMIAAMLVSTSGCAQLTPNEITGAVIGGLAGSQIGGGNGRVAAAAAGAVLGANLGRQVPQGVQSRGVPPGTYQPGYGYVYGEVPTYERNGVCDNELYIDGVYNPPAAQAMCRGRVDREYRAQKRYEQEAYRRGLEGR